MKRLSLLLLLGITSIANAAPPGGWDKTYSGPTRFKVLTNYNSEAVLDRETNLVWQRRPNLNRLSLPDSLVGCAHAATGGKQGWRLPRLDELASLVTPGVGLMPGHPFLGLAAGAQFWTDTIFNLADNASYSYLSVKLEGATFQGSSVAQILTSNVNLYYLCVRGPGSAR